MFNSPQKLTQEQKEYLISRCDESSTGKVLVPTRLIKKYREYSQDYISSNDIIRHKIIYLYSDM